MKREYLYSKEKSPSPELGGGVNERAREDASVKSRGSVAGALGDRRDERVGGNVGWRFLRLRPRRAGRKRRRWANHRHEVGQRHEVGRISMHDRRRGPGLSIIGGSGSTARSGRRKVRMRKCAGLRSGIRRSGGLGKIIRRNGGYGRVPPHETKHAGKKFGHGVPRAAHQLRGPQRPNTVGVACCSPCGGGANRRRVLHGPAFKCETHFIVHMESGLTSMLSIRSKSQK
jgi:hypothetical protein